LSRSAGAYARRESTRGLALLKEAFDLSTTSNCVVQRAEALLRLALDDTFNLRYEDAVARLTESAAVFRRYNVRGREAEASLQLGNALVLDGHASEAAPPLGRARELGEALGDRSLVLRAVNNLVYAIDEGPEKDVLRADALALAAAAADGAGLRCSVEHEWGDALFIQDRYAEALPKLVAAIACFTARGDMALAGRAHVSLGRVYRAHGRLDAALEEYARAFAMQQDGNDTLGAVQSLNAISVTLGYMGRHVEGLEWLQVALGMARRVGSQRTVDFLLANASQFYMDRGRYAEAASVLEETLVRPSPFYQSIRLADLSTAYLALQRPERALEVAERAVTIARGDSQQVSALAARANALTAVKKFDAATADLQRAVQIVETLRTQIVADDFFNRGFGQTYQWLFSSTIALLQSQGRSREAVETAERARARALLDLLAGRSRATQQADLNPRESSPATFDDIVATAARVRSTVVAYWVGQTETFVWVVKADGSIGSARIAVTSAELGDAVHEATSGSSQGQMAGLMLGAGSAGRHWRELYRLLIEPIREYLPTTDGSRLTIVPHGALFGLPFAALRDSRGRYLVETYDVHYVPAVAALRPQRLPAGTAASALLVGDPGAEAARDSLIPLPALPWANREVQTIATLLPAPPTVLVGGDATEANVRSQLEGRSLLHFATHGIVQNEERLSSYLALRPSASASPSSTVPLQPRDSLESGDGRLTANEAYGLRLDADLVVLSGCRTATGPIIGEGVIGFTRAFLAAGASSVVATMWNVEDQTSFETMKNFYAAWVAGADKSRALRRAQLAVLRSLRAGKIRVNGVALPDSPRLWAGYVLVGNP
jgi:CHAT domain-containing protein